MRLTVRDDAQRSRGDRRRLAADPNAAFARDHIEDLVQICMRVLDDSVAQLQHPRGRIGETSQHRFLERLAAADVVLVEEFRNRDDDRRSGRGVRHA